MAACIFPHVKAVPPRPDVSHPDSALYGIAKRMAYKPVPYKKYKMKRFRKFVRKWLRENMTPISQEEDFCFEEWLNSTNYEEWRKKELRAAFLNIVDQYEKKDGLSVHATVKYFVKEEWYPEYKHHRGIWARVDEFKCISGPFFKKVEEQLFKLKYFIKKIPKDQRAEYIMKIMGIDGVKFQTTDFTAYESHFKPFMMYNCEFELYKYMASCNPKAQKTVQFLFSVLAWANHVQNKYFTVVVKAKRMSGEMNTSLGNGFSNLMYLLFACEEEKIEFWGPVVEGDDGLLALSRDIPKKYFEDMGLNVKMETHENLSDASFCGLIFDPEELINIRDPRVPLVTCMWVPRKYTAASNDKIKGLIKSKAMSLMFEYPGCPILAVLGHKIFSLLADIPMYNHGENSHERRVLDNYYHRYESSDVPIKKTGLRTRALMERLFGISIQAQLMIEKSIEEMTLEKWDTGSALSIMPGLWIENYDLYCRNIINESPYSLNRIYQTSNTKNKYFNKLFKLHQVTGIRSKIGKIVTFDVFKKNSKFLGKSYFEVVKEYNEYVNEFYLEQELHRKNNLPINYGRHKH